MTKSLVSMVLLMKKILNNNSKSMTLQPSPTSHLSMLAHGILLWQNHQRRRVTSRISIKFKTKSKKKMKRRIVRAGGEKRAGAVMTVTANIAEGSTAVAVSATVAMVKKTKIVKRGVKGARSATEKTETATVIVITIRIAVIVRVEAADVPRSATEKNEKV